jgi:ligand-binding sensor domain-containing protein
MTTVQLVLTRTTLREAIKHMAEDKIADLWVANDSDGMSRVVEAEIRDNNFVINGMVYDPYAKVWAEYF